MAEGDGLRGLQMGKSRHQRCRMFFGALQEGFDQLFQRGCRALEFFLDPQAEIDGNLIVARARRVQAAGRCADQFGKARLDIHVNVFKFA